MDSMLPAGFSILNFVIFFLLTSAAIFIILVLFYVLISAVFDKLRKHKIANEAKEVHDNAYEDALKILDEARVKSVPIGPSSGQISAGVRRSGREICPMDHVLGSISAQEPAVGKGSDTLCRLVGSA